MNTALLVFMVGALRLWGIGRDLSLFNTQTRRASSKSSVEVVRTALASSAESLMMDTAIRMPIDLLAIWSSGGVEVRRGSSEEGGFGMGGDGSMGGCGGGAVGVAVGGAVGVVVGVAVGVVVGLLWGLWWGL